MKGWSENWWKVDLKIDKSLSENWWKVDLKIDERLIRKLIKNVDPKMLKKVGDIFSKYTIKFSSINWWKVDRKIWCKRLIWKLMKGWSENWWKVDLKIDKSLSENWWKVDLKIDERLIRKLIKNVDPKMLKKVGDIFSKYNIKFSSINWWKVDLKIDKSFIWKLMKGWSENERLITKLIKNVDPKMLKKVGDIFSKYTIKLSSINWCTLWYVKKYACINGYRRNRHSFYIRLKCEFVIFKV